MSSGTYSNAYLVHENANGSFTAEQQITGSATVSVGGSNTLTFGEKIEYTDSYGTEALRFDGPVTENGVVVGFAAIDPSTGAIYVFSNAVIPQGTTLVVQQGEPYTICFMAGTNVATPDGEKAIECLVVGDDVLTSEGTVKPVKWIGRQTVSTVFADPLRVNPIQILAGALDDSLPIRDLFVSPDHALLVDGVLVQAAALVNGLSILQVRPNDETFVYYHVELDDHSLILAEGVAAETFVDNVDRRAFDNWEEHEALYSHTNAVAEMDLPRAKSQRQVPVAVKARLLDRAELLGLIAKAA